MYTAKASSNKLARGLSPDGHLGRRSIVKRERDKKREKARKISMKHKQNK
jgi:hypothetical protein